MRPWFRCEREAKDSKIGQKLLSNARPDRICVPVGISLRSQKINMRSRYEYALEGHLFGYALLDFIN